MRLGIALVVLVLAGCTAAKDDCVGAVAYVDQDGDGFGDARRAVWTCDPEAPTGVVADATDCDDADASRYPGAVEACDGTDHDCDGLRDEPDSEDAAEWFADLDHDGYGDPASALRACTAPPGAVSDATDCGPTDPAVHPGAAEVCDGAGVDEDCDGLADGADSDAEGVSPGYLDADGDGWGGTTEAAGCAGSGGWSASSGDCDDADAATYPGAPESCTDGLDHDCDGAGGATDADGDGAAGCVDCDDGDPAVAPSAVEVCNGVDDDCDGIVDGPLSADATESAPDVDGDGHGDLSLAVWGCAPPDGFVADVDDCDDHAPGVHPGARESCRTDADDDCDGDDNDVDATACIDVWQDGDGDGYGGTVVVCQCAPDAVYTALAGDDCDDGDAGVSPGAAELCMDGVDQDCDGTDLCSLGDLDTVALGPADSASFASAVAFGTDVTGDGVADLVVGDSYYAGVDGRVQIYAGPIASPGGLPSWTLSGGSGTVSYGRMIELGDLDGDGVGDVIAATAYTDWGGHPNTGATFVHFGPILSDMGVSDAGLIAIGPDDSEAGEAATFVDDIDQDGVPELAAGGMDLLGAGAIALVPGDRRGLVQLADATEGVYGTTTMDPIGSSVASTDWNGDGVPDLAIGAPYTDSGVVHLVEGPITGLVASDDADGQWEGGSSSPYFGESLNAPGDVDGDGLGDLVGQTLDMAALLTGVSHGATAMTDSTATFRDCVSGSAPAVAADFNGDGSTDLALAAYYLDGYPDGVVSVFVGPVVGTFDLGDAAWGALGSWPMLVVGEVGDADGDGREDTYVGGEELDGEAAGSGAVVLLSGALIP